MLDINEEQMIFIRQVRCFIEKNCGLFDHVIMAASQGMKDSMTCASKRAQALETCLMHHVVFNQVPEYPYLTYKTIAKKLKEIEPYLMFRWDDIIEQMENSPEKLSSKKSRKNITRDES